ncbi:MAG: hypothetical protein ABEJ65_05155, partial [bacterium]
LQDENLQETFRDAGVRYAISRNAISSRLLATHIYEPDVAETLEKLFTSTNKMTPEVENIDTSEDQTGYDLRQFKVGPDFTLENGSPSQDDSYTFGSIVTELRSQLGAVPLGLYTDGELIQLPSHDTPVKPGDYLLIAFPDKNVSKLLSILDVQSENRLKE